MYSTNKLVHVDPGFINSCKIFVTQVVFVTIVTAIYLLYSVDAWLSGLYTVADVYTTRLTTYGVPPSLCKLLPSSWYLGSSAGSARYCVHGNIWAPPCEPT
jgi:hypothetical protein